MDENSLRQQGFRPYRKTSITLARPMAHAFTVTLINGDQITGQPGDYACVSVDGRDRWIVGRSIFLHSYQHEPQVPVGSAVQQLMQQGFQAYFKHQVTWARRLETAQVIQTREGPVHAAAGDYLCVGASGDQWPQQAARFEATYRMVTQNQV